jgi:hypothetical protein
MDRTRFAATWVSIGVGSSCRALSEDLGVVRFHNGQQIVAHAVVAPSSVRVNVTVTASGVRGSADDPGLSPQAVGAWMSGGFERFKEERWRHRFQPWTARPVVDRPLEQWETPVVYIKTRQKRRW